MANLITYIFSGVGSGSLGTAGFTNAEFRITIPTNTDCIYTDNSIYPAGTPMVSSAMRADEIAIAGLNTTVFERALNIAVLSINQSHESKVALGEAPDLLLGIAGSEFRGYGLNHAIGPVSGVATVTGRTFPTAAGALVFSNIASAAFQAILPAVTTHPKPSR